MSQCNALLPNQVWSGLSFYVLEYWRRLPRGNTGKDYLPSSIMDENHLCGIVISLMVGISQPKLQSGIHEMCGIRGPYAQCWKSGFLYQRTRLLLSKNLDRRQADPEVSERFHKLSFELSDHEVDALIPSDDDSPLPESQSFSSYELHSSPPQLTTATNVEDRDAHYSLSSSVVISSSDSEFPSIQRLIATTPTTYTPGGV